MNQIHQFLDGGVEKLGAENKRRDEAHERPPDKRRPEEDQRRERKRREDDVGPETPFVSKRVAPSR